MTIAQNPYRFAGHFFYLSAALHVAAIAVSFGDLFAQLIVPVFLWTFVGYGLVNRPKRWLAHLGFIGALVGIVASISIGTPLSGLPRFVMTGILAADLGAAVLLFGTLWRAEA